MSISSAIAAAQGRVADCYTAISGKGGTLPATQDLANMPTAIDSIPSGGGGSKYGCTIDGILGDVNESGVLTYPSSPATNLVFTGVEDIANFGLMYKFYNNTAITGLSFPDLTAISGQSACNYAFSYCANITSLLFPELVTISGGCQRMFQGCTGLTSVSFPELTTISATNACQYMFQLASNITTITFPKLKTISGSNCLQYMFWGTKIQTVSFDALDTFTASNACSNMFASCGSLRSISFPALTTTSFGSNTNQLKGMFSSTTASTQNPCTVHFPSNLQAVVSGLDGYPLFGGSSGKILISFDLTATT